MPGVPGECAPGIKSAAKHASFLRSDLDMPKGEVGIRRGCWQKQFDNVNCNPSKINAIRPQELGHDSILAAIATMMHCTTMRQSFAHSF